MIHLYRNSHNKIKELLEIRALQLSNFEICMALKLSKFECFRALKLSNLAVRFKDSKTLKSEEF